MADSFTYSSPDEAEYHKAVLLILHREGHLGLYEALRGTRCSINDGNSYSKRRWNAYYTTVSFQVPMQRFQSFEITDDERETLLGVCNQAMPAETGFDVMNVEFSPMLGGAARGESLENDLEMISESLRDTSAEFTLPRDVLEKGRQMGEAYLYLYAVENYLRVFIEEVATREHGADFFSHLNVPKRIANALHVRKQQESKNRWISIRGDSDLFYMDFKDLGDLALNNWGLFKGYFPDQSWISSKIDELGSCRNLVAHNSFLGEHERDVIRVNFTSIARQLNSFME